jgi:hypothetical protein
MTATYTIIGQNTLSSNASSVTFSSIPSTYEDLVLKTCTRDTYSGTVDALMYVSLNSATNQFTDTFFSFRGPSSATSRNSTTGNIGVELYGSTGANATTDCFGNMEFYIPNYAGSLIKIGSSFGTPETNTASFNFGGAIVAGTSNVTSAINQIVIRPSISFLSGSSFYLYGIKNS